MFEKKWLRGLCIVFLNMAIGASIISSPGGWKAFFLFQIPVLILLGIFFWVLNGRHSLLKSLSFSLIMLLFMPVAGVWLTAPSAYGIVELLKLDTMAITAAWWQSIAGFVINSVLFYWYDRGPKG
jgi:hypothetical protein